MKVIPPIKLTPSMVVQNVYDSLPVGTVAYSPLTSYAKDAFTYVIRNGTAYDLFKSRTVANLGNPLPSTDSANTYWLGMGTVYLEWVPGTYNLGQIVTSDHENYESLVASNTAVLTDKTKWQYLGPTNARAAFDDLRNTRTVSNNEDLYFKISLTERVDSIALIGLSGSSVTVEMYTGQLLKYRNVQSLNGRNTKSWKDYYFTLPRQKSTVALFDLPMYSNSRIEITIKQNGGTRAVGGIILGRSIYLGETQYQPKVKNLNFTEIERNFAGDVTIIPRRNVPIGNLTVQFKQNMTDTLQDACDLLNGVPAFWSGIEDTQNPYFRAVQVYGPYKEFSLDLTNHAFGFLTLEIEEM